MRRPGRLRVHGARDAALALAMPLLGLVAFVAVWWLLIAVLVPPTSFLAGWSPAKALHHSRRQSRADPP